MARKPARKPDSVLAAVYEVQGAVSAALASSHGAFIEGLQADAADFGTHPEVHIRNSIRSLVRKGAYLDALVILTLVTAHAKLAATQQQPAPEGKPEVPPVDNRDGAEPGGAHNA